MSDSSPNWPTGYNPSSAEWNAEWASKADATGGTITSPVITGATITSSTFSGTIGSLSSPLGASSGGTGVNNGTNTITLGGALVTTGGALTINLSGSTILTFPTTGTFLTNVLASARILLGNGSNVATAVTPSGDWTMTNAGVATVTQINGSAAFAGHGLVGVQVFTSGASTYTPTSGTNRVIIEVQAPGGGSGGCALTGAGAASVSGSGGSGAYAKVFYTTGFSGITMTVGAVGAAGTAGNNAGGAGGTTTAGALISCVGGTGGLGGAAVSTSALQAMNFGIAATAAPTISGGTIMMSVGGQGSGLCFANQSTNGTQFAGQSGSSPLGIGVPSGVAINAATTTGFAGTGYGWGAGSALNAASQAATAGLAGGPGRIVVWELN